MRRRKFKGEIWTVPLGPPPPEPPEPPILRVLSDSYHKGPIIVRGATTVEGTLNLFLDFLRRTKQPTPSRVIIGNDVTQSPRIFVTCPLNEDGTIAERD